MAGYKCSPDGESMKDKIVIQDYLFLSALVFKIIAFFTTLYVLDIYTCLYERNPLTRFLLQNHFAHALFQLAAIALMCIGYSVVRKIFRREYRRKVIRWSFNALVALVFMTYLWDAANDVTILLAETLTGIRC